MFIDLIKYPIKVDKYQVKQLKNGNWVYTFKLDVRLTKPQIKNIFETLFNIKIISVNTIITQKKRYGQNYKPRFKKAILTVPSPVGFKPQNFELTNVSEQENTTLVINQAESSKSALTSETDSK
jgi:ribosomal protein L23